MFESVKMFAVEGVPGVVFTSRGVACDSRKNANDSIFEVKVVTDNKFSSSMIRAIHSKNGFASDYFPIGEMAISDLCMKVGNVVDTKDIKFEYAVINRTSVSIVSDDDMFVIMIKNGNDGYYADVVDKPEIYGYKYPKFKRYFSHNLWGTVSEGPARVKVVEDRGSYGFIIGDMIRFDKCPLHMSIKFVNDLYEDGTIRDIFGRYSVNLFTIDSPVRGRYLALADVHNDKCVHVCVDTDDNKYLVDDESGVVMKDIKEFGKLVKTFN